MDKSQEHQGNKLHKTRKEYLPERPIERPVESSWPLSGATGSWNVPNRRQETSHHIPTPAEEDFESSSRRSREDSFEVETTSLKSQKSSAYTVRIGDD
jgi:hypothetical protein